MSVSMMGKIECHLKKAPSSTASLSNITIKDRITL